MKPSFYDKVDEFWNLERSPESCQPIFLVSSIWRTGSTLTQRLLASSKEVLMWGEPFASSSIIQNLHQTTRPFLDPFTKIAWNAFTPTRMPEQNRELIRKSPGTQWIANLYPDIAELKSSYRVMLDRLFFEPAQKEGYDRFGIKFVRLTVEHVEFLQWMYPDARIVFLTRNPYDCWNSYSGCNWMYSYPNLNISKPVPFVKIWEKNTREFLAFEHPNSAFFRYEDIVSKADFREQLRQHCQLDEIVNDILQVRQHGMAKTQERKGISGRDIQQIEKIAATTAKKLGYLGHKQTVDLN